MRSQKYTNPQPPIRRVPTAPDGWNSLINQPRIHITADLPDQFQNLLTAWLAVIDGPGHRRLQGHCLTLTKSSLKHPPTVVISP